MGKGRAGFGFDWTIAVIGVTQTPVVRRYFFEADVAMSSVIRNNADDTGGAL